MASRRQEILSATLELLATVPVERVTTRAIASRVGVSQPALFRHFTSRDEILRSVVREVASMLRDELHGILSRGPDLPDAARELAEVLFTLAGRHPGIPALFFHDAVEGPRSASHDAVQHLVSVPGAFLAELVRSAAREGRLVHPVDADGSAEIFVALLQGALIQARRGGQALDPTRSATRVAAFWWAAVQAGEPHAVPRDGVAAVPHERLVTLNVRPIIGRGEDPLASVLETIGRIRSDGALLVLAPFRPLPLETLLGARGWRARARELDPDTWSLELLGPDCPEPEDLTELEAPLPLERVLLLTASLGRGDVALFRVPRRPVPLLERLRERGLGADTATAPDGVTLLRVRGPVATEEGPA